MTEAELASAVLELAAELGVLAHACGDSRHCRGAAGFPDLVLAGQRGIIFAELKSDTGETTAEQDNWVWRLAFAGGPSLATRLWRPEVLENGRIRQQLEAIA